MTTDELLKDLEALPHDGRMRRMVEVGRMAVADQTWAYGEFLVSPWADGKMALGGELIPTRKSVAQTPEFKNLPARLSHLNLLSQAVADWGYSNPQAPVPYAPHLLLAYHRIVSENLPVEKALQDSAADYNKQVAESKKK